MRHDIKEEIVSNPIAIKPMSQELICDQMITRLSMKISMAFAFLKG